MTHRIAWFHPFSGIAGDMALGACLDAGADVDAVRAVLDRLDLPGWSLEVHPVLRGGLAATHVEVHVHDELVVQAPFKDIARVKDWLEEAMGAPAQIGDTLAGVPATADPGFSWGTTMAYDKFREAHPWI